MKQHKLAGYVLARKNIGEADRLVRFYSHSGKTAFVARGVRKLGSRRAAHLEPFALVQVQLHQGRSLDTLTQTQSLRPSPIDTSALDQVASGYAILELVDRMLEDNQSVDGLVEVIEQLLALVGKGEPIDKVMGYLCIYLLHDIGSQPSITEASAEQYYFDYQEGLVVVERSEHSLKLSQDVVKLWRLLPQLSVQQLSRLKADSAVFAQSWQLLSKYLEYHFHIRLRSTQLL